MPKDVSAILENLLDKLRKRGQSDDEILRVVDTQGDRLLDKFADVITDAARGGLRSREVFPISVNYDLPLRDAIDAGDYQAVNASITAGNFPTSQTGKADLGVVLVRYDRRMESEDVIDELNKEGLRPTDLREFLAFGAAYPEMQRKFSINGLGSVWKDRKGYKNVPCLFTASEGRYLDLHWWDDGWYSYSRFAAVRK